MYSRDRYNGAVNEAELARILVQRGVLGDAQLREAESYARGGRSVFSVLLDLGHVKPEDLGALVPPPAPPRRNPLPWLLFAAAAAFLAFCAGLAFAPRAPARDFPRPVVHPEFLFARECVNRALPLLRRAEEAAGPVGTARSPELARAAALLEQASLEGDPGIDVLYPLARSRELLDQDDAARALYARILERYPSHGRTLAGLSRTTLQLGQASAALAYADRAVQWSPGAESYLARAKAAISLGRTADARRDLVEAARRDRSYADAANALLRRLESSR